MCTTKLSSRIKHAISIAHARIFECGVKWAPFFDYLRTRFSDLSAGDRVLFQLDNFHKLFQTLPESSEEILYTRSSSTV